MGDAPRVAILCLPEGLWMAVRRQEAMHALGRGRVVAFLKKSTVRESLLAYVFIGPMVVILLVLIAYPFLNAIYLSMTDKIVGYPPIFVGLKNYAELWESSQYRQVIYNSVAYTVGSVAIKLALGVAMALVLNRAPSGRG